MLNMNPRESVNVGIVVLAIIVLAGLTGYFMLFKKSPPGAPTPIPRQPVTSIEYSNAQYGFSFSLPAGWKGYSIVVDTWEGYTTEVPEGYAIIEHGPIISIRHPEWTSQNPRQDIPIMVFTLDQWAAMQEDKFHIGAAPIGPSELGRSRTAYVFALPARYNFRFPTGFEEVGNILEGKPFRAL